MELVSVILPVYNVEKHLHQCVQSVQNQTYQNLEIILVDDGSTDQCGAMCDSYAIQDTRIKVVHKANAGLGFARNSGLEVATGAYVLFIDSDDWIDEQMVSIMVHALEQYNADMAGIGFKCYSNSNKTSFNRTLQTVVFEGYENIVQHVLLPVIGSDATKNRPDGREMSVCSNIYRKSIIDAYQLRFVSERVLLTEDFFYNIPYVSKCERIVFLPDNLYYYRYNAVSLSRGYRPNKIELLFAMTKAAEALLVNEGLKGLTGYRLERSYFKRLRNCLMQISDSTIPKAEKVRKYRDAINNDLTVRMAKTFPCRYVRLQESIFIRLIRARMYHTTMAFLALQRCYLRMIRCN